MPKRDPHLVLGVARDAPQSAVKAAWRRLAREHHPDLVGEDAAASRRATREMAEINAAYEELRDPERRRAWVEGRPAGPGRHRAGASGDEQEAGAARPRATPPSRRERPVTARLDTSELFRPRNATLNPQPGSPLPGWAPRPRSAFHAEPPRASEATGPLQRRVSQTFRRILPSLEDALLLELRFGKFHGHTLGEIADFEPSYIDWIVRTLADPELVAAARVIQDAMDRAGILRRPPADRRERDEQPRVQRASA